MYQTIRYEKQGNIGILTINRPEALNALNSAVVSDLEQAISEVEKDAELGALIITGEELHIGKLSLDGGEMQVDGRIDAVTYEDTEVRQGSFLSRLFG